MRACYKYAVAPAGIADLGQKSLQVHRFRCGVGRRIIAERRVVGNRAEEAGLRARSLDDGVDERGRRGLAVGARHRYELERRDWMPEEISGGEGPPLSPLPSPKPPHRLKPPPPRPTLPPRGHRPHP